MKPAFLFILISTTLISCNQKKSENSVEPETSYTDSIVATTQHTETLTAADNSYFRAHGAEPFWSLSISEQMIELKTLNDSLFTPHADPILAADSNVKLYKLKTELTTMDIQISHKDCINSASGQTSPYTVTINYKKGEDSDFIELEGCGTYITDYRLHDIWVLESINGKEVSQNDFGKDLPSMEINSSSNTFSGSTGCNRMTGSLFSENATLRFIKVAVTKMACIKGGDKEKEFLTALNSSTRYTIENNRLTLFNPDKSLLVFKKVD